MKPNASEAVRIANSIKLSEINDVEKDINFDLAVLFYALKHGIYDKELDRHVVPCLTWHEVLDELVLFYDDYNTFINGCYRFKDFGIKWALTKAAFQSNVSAIADCKYIRKQDESAWRAEIKKHIELFLQTESHASFGWNCIVENYVWHKLKRSHCLTSFPSNLYKIVRDEMRKYESNT